MFQRAIIPTTQEGGGERAFWAQKLIPRGAYTALLPLHFIIIIIIIIIYLFIISAYVPRRCPSRIRFFTFSFFKNYLFDSPHTLTHLPNRLIEPPYLENGIWW